MKAIIVIFMCMVIAVAPVFAQEDCPDIVAQALESAGEVCADTGRNQACYGNFDLTAELRADVSDVEFTQAGDITDLTNIEGLTLSGMDEDAGAWGVALLQMQANLPDTLPGQNVTMLLFGDVEIIDASTESEDEVQPMQAFYFRSGIGDAPCAEAPNSGILIQTPEGAGTIELTMNDVNITLGSTAYIQAEPEGEMVFNVIEGEGVVEAEDVERTVPAGSRVTVEIDEDLHAEEAPSEVEPYDAAEFSALPIDLLPREIEIAGTEATSQAGVDVEIASGTWTMTYVSTEGCGVDPGVITNVPVSETSSEDLLLFFEAAGETMTFQGSEMTVTNPETGVYVVEFDTAGTLIRNTYTILSETSISLVSEIIATDCTITTTADLEHTGD
jgi:hypothetical protein